MPSEQQPLTGGLLDRFWANPTVLVLVQDRWFRRVLVAVILLVTLVAAVVLKVWPASPPGIKPVVRISQLDRLQAWSLRRTAERADRAGNLNDAMIAWRSAMANNPGDPQLTRDALSTLARAPGMPRKFLFFALHEGQRLIRLSNTNSADLQLLARICSQFGLHDSTVRLLEYPGVQLDTGTAGLLIEADFFLGRMAEFERTWQAHPALTNQPKNRILFDAWASVWGPPAGMQAARSRLAAARSDFQLGPFAARCQLPVSQHLSDVATYRAALDQLIERREDKPGQHVTYWNLLMQAGRTPDAARLAREYSRPPETPAEAVLMARAFTQLGMTEYAAEFLGKQLTELGYRSDLWLLRAELLVRLKRWNEVRELAVRLRQHETLGTKLSAYTYYLEGIVELALRRPEAAADQFNRVPEGSFETPLLAYQTATQLRALGHPKPAAELLRRYEAEFGSTSRFWTELTLSAYSAREMDTMAAAAARAYELDPDNLTCINNQAAALIAFRRNPEEAVKLTFKLISKLPTSVDARINHVLALLNNGRADDARRLLRTVKPDGLNATQFSVLQFAWFECHLQSREPAEARRAADAIDRRLILPPQVAHLEAGLKQLAGG
jgi:tetratricopeptide (TPR) repeat protein